MDTTTIYLGSDAPIQLEPFNGFTEVLDGDPAAGVSWLRTTASGDATLFAGIFVAQPSRFRYDFTHDECIHVIEGDLDITLDGHPPVHLMPGAIASFPAGTRSTWTIHTTLRKFFVIAG